MRRRTVLRRGASLLAAGSLPSVARAQAPKVIRIGYVLSLSGPNAPGAQFAAWSQYRLWTRDVNDSGGIMLKKYGMKVPVELVDYDDRSQIEEVPRLVERLILDDKVDLVLPPWGTAANLAAAPVLNGYGYPAIHHAASAARIAQRAPRWPWSFWALVQPGPATAPLSAMVSTLAGEGRIRGRVAIMHVADQTGVDLAAAMQDACRRDGVEVVYVQSYPLGVSDLSPHIREAAALGPDAFLAFSYPADTLLVTGQSHELGFSPPIYYTGIGTSSPVYAAKFGTRKNGVLMLGAVDPAARGQKAYRERYQAMFSRGLDICAIGAYATLQILQKAIEQAGEIDRKKIRETIARGTFETVADVYNFKDQMHQNAWAVGQWQDDEVVGVYPADKRGARPLLFPKPKW